MGAYNQLFQFVLHLTEKIILGMWNFQCIRNEIEIQLNPLLICQTYCCEVPPFAHSKLLIVKEAPINVTWLV